jgi:CRP-like cAMP-binding protein
MLSQYPRFVVPAHRFLARRGEPVRECFLIVSGAIERRDGTGRPVRSGPGELVGADAMMGSAPGSIDLLTATETEVIVLDRRELHVALAGSANLRALVDETDHIGVAA